MINNVCVSCHQSMNGGVYRKPNQCPHCSMLQNDKRTAANKLISPELRKTDSNDDSELARTSFKDNELVVEQFDGMDSSANRDAEEILGGSESALSDELSLTSDLSAGHTVEVSAGLDEYAEKDVDEVPIVIESAVSNVEAIAVNSVDEGEDFDLYLEEDIELTETVEVVCFDNVESRPDVNESLDIALNFDEAPVPLTPIVSGALLSAARVGEEEVNQGGSAKQEIVAANSESNVVNLKEKIGEVKAAKAAANAVVQDVPVNDTAASIEVETEAVAVGSMKKTHVSVLPRQYESVVLTTETARNLDIEKRLDLVTSECVIGTDVVQRDLSTRGGFSRAEYASSPNALKDARKMVLDEIKKEAFLLGANTVVEVKLEYSEISKGESAMMMVVATGTAVKAKAA